MIDQLYQKAILKHAANACAHGSLAEATHRLTVHNPLCGDRITIHIKTDHESLVGFAHETKACVLCQASASILGEYSVGETSASLQHIYEGLKEGLKEESLKDRTWPVDKWEALNIFQPVAAHKNRHGCVTLPFETLIKALNGDME